MKTAHKHLALTHMRALVQGHRNQWAFVETDAYASHDPTVLILTACVGALMDLLDDRLDELQEGAA